MLFIYGYVGVYVLVSIQKGKLSYSVGRGLGDRTIIYSQRHGVYIYVKMENYLSYSIM